MNVRFETIWAVLNKNGKKVNGWFDRQSAILDAKQDRWESQEMHRGMSGC